MDNVPFAHGMMRRDMVMVYFICSAEGGFHSWKGGVSMNVVDGVEMVTT